MKEQKPQQSQAGQGPGRDSEAAGKQVQDSRQSGDQGGAGRQQGGPATSTTTGIGSSQGQDKGSREGSVRTGPGTADIERSSARNQDAARPQDSIVNDPTGAYKERP